MVKPGEIKSGLFWKMDAERYGGLLCIEITSGPHSREGILELVKEFLEWLDKTAEAPKP